MPIKKCGVLRQPYRQSSSKGRAVRRRGGGGPGVADPQPEARGDAAGHRPIRQHPLGDIRSTITINKQCLCIFFIYFCSLFYIIFVSRDHFDGEQ